MDQDGAPKVRLGYCALTNAGYSAVNPPADLSRAIAEVNRTFVASWARGLAGAGLPSDRLYTHVAASAGYEGAPALDFTNAPLRVAFNDVSRPGFTTYPWERLRDGFDPVYQELATHGS